MIEVVCALIFQDGKVLITQLGPASGHPGKWEFPGGKVGKNEPEEDAICREIMEELGIKISARHKLNPVGFNYPGKSVRLTPFICTSFKGDIILTEHTGAAWVSEGELTSFDMLDADRLILCSTENRKILSGYFRENMD